MDSKLYDLVTEVFDNGDLDKTYPPSVYTAYLEAFEKDVDDLLEFPGTTRISIDDSYAGYFESTREFIESIREEAIEHMGDLIIDWKATWEANLRHSYTLVTDDSFNPDTGAGWYFQDR